MQGEVTYQVRSLDISYTPVKGAFRLALTGLPAISVELGLPPGTPCKDIPFPPTGTLGFPIVASTSFGLPFTSSGEGTPGFPIVASTSLTSGETGGL